MSTSKQSPVALTLASLSDIVGDLPDIDIYDINLFLFKHPSLAPSARNDDQPNDITKLSLKMMSEYILSYGIASDDATLTPISVTTGQTFNKIFYTHTISGGDDNQRPATVADVFNSINDLLVEPVVEALLSASAFTSVNPLKPDYVLSLDEELTTDKLFKLTQSNYTELQLDNFMYIGSITGYTAGTHTGLLDPTTTTILASHSHNNMIYNADGVTPAISVTTNSYVSNSRGNSRVISESHAMSARRYDDGDHSAAFLTNAGMSKLSAGPKMSIKGNIEDQINANSIRATCLNNVVPSVEDKLSIRYKARHYKIFEKQLPT